MKASKLLVVAVAAFLLSFGAAYAQVSFSVGGTVPLSDFANKDLASNGLVNTVNGTTGGANIGAMAGFKYQAKLPIHGLSIMGTVDVMWNDISKKVIEDYLGGEDITYPDFFNVPVMAGLNYTLPIVGEVAVYAEAGVGCNIRHITKTKSAALNTEISYDPAFTLAYQAGAGIKINKLLLSATYYVLGAAPIEGELLTSFFGEYSADMTFGEVNPNLLAIRVGFVF